MGIEFFYFFIKLSILFKTMQYWNFMKKCCAMCTYFDSDVYMLSFYSAKIKTLHDNSFSFDFIFTTEGRTDTTWNYALFSQQKDYLFIAIQHWAHADLPHPLSERMYSVSGVKGV